MSFCHSEERSDEESFKDSSLCSEWHRAIYFVVYYNIVLLLLQAKKWNQILFCKVIFTDFFYRLLLSCRQKFLFFLWQETEFNLILQKCCDNAKIKKGGGVKPPSSRRAERTALALSYPFYRTASRFFPWGGRFYINYRHFHYTMFCCYRQGVWYENLFDVQKKKYRALWYLSRMPEDK